MHPVSGYRVIYGSRIIVFIFRIYIATQILEIHDRQKN